MPYIGTPAVDRFTASKAATQFSGNGSAVDFTLDHSVGSPEDILVSVDGVVQEPTVAYGIVSGTTLRFTTAPSSNSGNNIFVYYLFRTLGTVAHPATSALSATSGTFTGNIVIPNAGNIGSASDADAMAIASGGVVTFSQNTVGAGDMVLISTITASGEDEIDFTSVFTSAYTDYEIHGSNIHTSGDSIAVSVRVFVGGSIKSDSHYRSARIRNYSGDSGYAGAAEQTDTEFAKICGELTGNAAGEHTNFRMTIYNPLGTDNFKTLETKASTVDRNGDHFQIYSSGHYKNGVAALTGIRFFVASGNIATGTFKLYGRQ